MNLSITFEFKIRLKALLRYLLEVQYYYKIINFVISKSVLLKLDSV